MGESAATLVLFLAACFGGPIVVILGAGIVAVIARKNGRK